jgi:hypothetical protein
MDVGPRHEIAVAVEADVWRPPVRPGVEDIGSDGPPQIVNPSAICRHVEGDAATLDYRPTRLKAHLDGHRIASGSVR